MDVIKKDAVGGIITFWTLSDLTDREAVVQGFGKADLAQFVPEPQEAVTVLKDALTKAVAGRNTLIRPLAKRTGFEVVRETKGQERNSFEHLARAEVTATDRPLVVAGSPDWTEEWSRAVYNEFAAFSGMIPAQRLATALVNIAYSLGGVRLRPTGGLYFLPGEKMVRWEEAATVVERAGKNTVYKLVQELTPDAVRAVRDALANETESESKRLHAEILSGELGERALQTRRDELASLQKKLLSYEQILGVGLEDLRTRVEAVGNLGLTAELLASDDLAHLE